MKAQFAYTEVDCFGPFIVKQGRKQMKRWGCLFTCLTTRAIHLDLLSALDATDKKLRAADRRWKTNAKVPHTLLKKEIEWVFNPPYASHIYQRGWKHAQFLADQFWKRWLKEDLPSLRQRRKYFKQLRNFQ
ncbi:uncharacterized protein LOC121853981, partial [Homarus americanus]|uniref:uncharacterized protein LOC121853981 n=1 Tax=Homarus americanus TaxID=6706 RepID=UPI001C443A1D